LQAHRSVKRQKDEMSAGVEVMSLQSRFNLADRSVSIISAAKIHHLAHRDRPLIGRPPATSGRRFARSRFAESCAPGPPRHRIALLGASSASLNSFIEDC